MSKMTRSGWLVASTAIALVLATGTAAQTAAPTPTPTPTQPPAQDPAPASSLDDVVVTGSRLPAGNLGSTSPVAVLGSEDLSRAGVLQVSEAINQLPQLGAASGARSQNNNSLNSGFGFGGEYINLRNLGIQRTLVLVNGRRHVPGDPGKSSVDLTTIPSIMVDRVEVTTGAASAVYGADAVSGVVNILLDTDFAGARMRARAGVSGEGDGEEYGISAMFGSSFADNRGHGLIAAEYSDSHAIQVSDRPYGFADIGGTVASFATPLLSNGSTATPGGRFVASNLFFDDANVLRTQTPNDRYARYPHKNLQNPTDRFVLSGVVNYDLATGDRSAQIYSEASYSRTHTTFRYEAAPALFSGGNYGTANETPPDLPLIPQTNPFLLNLPMSVRTAIGVVPAAGLNFQRRLEEFGERNSLVDRQTYRGVLGVRGDLGAGYSYDLSYQYGRVSAEQDDQGTIGKDRLVAALNVNDNGTPLNTADDTCADVRYRLLGCTPVNVFGVGTITPEFIAYATVPGLSRSASTQEVVSGFVRGAPLSLPAGDVGVVLGAEYRRETVDVNPAQTFVEGSNLTKKILGIEAGMSVAETFGEFTVPLLADLPFVRRLDFGGAVRLSDYSTVGQQTAWSLRLDYEVTPILRLRATYGSAVRAPNLYELYAPRTAAISNVIDPCDRVSDGGAAITLSAARQASCAAALGGFAAGLDQTQVQRQTVGNISQGNENLDPEDALTFTGGFVLRPGGAFAGASLTADYYQIRIRDVISQLTIQNIVNRCYDSAGLPEVFCNQINRSTTTGQLLSVSNSFLNAATDTVKGVEVVGRYDFELEDVASGLPGSLSAQMTWSHLFDRTFVQFGGAAPDHVDGQVGDFQNRLDVALAYHNDRFGLSYNARYLASALADTSQNLGPKNFIDSMWYQDLQATYALDDRLTLAAGVKNLFEEEPPIISGPARTSPNGEVTATGVYDVRGRFFYLSADLSF